MESKRPELSVNLDCARRLAIAKQHLSENHVQTSSASILQLVRELGCVQIDPISVVAPSHQIVLWSRLGQYKLPNLDRLLWREKKFFEYWAHQASIVLMEDYPLYYTMMQSWPDNAVVPKAWRGRIKKWFAEKTKVRRYVVNELKEKGPLLSRQLEKPKSAKSSFGWGSWNDVSRMLYHLYWRGDVMVAGRQGIQKLWDLTEEFLPEWAEKEVLTQDDLEHGAVQRSIKALGIASPEEIKWHFLRRRYQNLTKTLGRLEEESLVQRVMLEGGGKPGVARYIHRDDLRLLDKIESGRWQPRTTLLSPFDNLICDRKRMSALFGFQYTIEIYTPQSKRKHGYYVLPILDGDLLIGRVDPVMDRKNGRLIVKAVYAEGGAPKDRATGERVAGALEDLNAFLGGKEVAYSRKVPEFWQGSLR